MAYRGPVDVGFFQVAGYQLAGALTASTFSKDAPTEMSRGLGETWDEHDALGTKAFELSQQGFYDDETDGLNDVALAAIGAAQVVSLALAGNVVGRRFVGFQGPLVGAYQRLASRDGLHKANLTYRGNGQLDEGVILQERESKGADWDTEGADSVDHGASSAAGGAGYLQVETLDLDGYDDLTVTVRHSADDVTYADLVAFTAVTVGRTAERVTVAGTVNRHLAVSGVFGGTGTTPEVTLTVGFCRF